MSIWLLFGLNGWNKVEQGWNRIGVIRTTLTTLPLHKWPNLDPRGSQNGSKLVYMATIGSKWSLVPKNGWNKVEQGWKRIGGIKTDRSVHFTTP